MSSITSWFYWDGSSGRSAKRRVNGDMVADDGHQGGLAELDEITGNDIVSTLARIVTGDAQLEAPNLQQAFAEANVSIRQANAIVGEYEVVDNEHDAAPEVETATGSAAELTSVRQFPSQQTLVFDAGHIEDQAAPGKTIEAHTDGVVPSASPNGAEKEVGSNRKAVGSRLVAGNQVEKKDEAEDEASDPPPVPRPRLLFDQFTSR